MDIGIIQNIFVHFSLCRKEICTRINILYPKNVDKNEVVSIIKLKNGYKPLTSFSLIKKKT